MCQNIEHKEWHTTSNKGFHVFEVDKLKRIYTIAKSSIENPSGWRNMHRKDFAIFIDEHDRRRGTNFAETFPELVEFHQACKNIKD
jgi:hypothetical protein